MEETDYLHIIRQKIPKISDLSSRLKTKLVQDPLVLDSQGNLLVEENVLRSVVSRLTTTGRVLKELLRDWCANEYYWVVSDLVTLGLFFYTKPVLPTLPPPPTSLLPDQMKSEIEMK